MSRHKGKYRGFPVLEMWGDTCRADDFNGGRTQIPHWFPALGSQEALNYFVRTFYDCRNLLSFLQNYHGRLEEPY